MPEPAFLSKTYYVYILATRRNGTLYVGVTDNLRKRAEQHRAGTFEGFTKKYKIHTLVYYEQTSSINAAIAREKQIKGGSRQNKINLIETQNPEWEDLYQSIIG